MVVSQGDVVWLDFAPPTGSGPGFRRPAVIVQADALNRSAIATTICVPLTSNLKWSGALGNVVLSRRATGLSKDSVANVSLVVAIDKSLVTQIIRGSDRSLVEADAARRRFANLCENAKAMAYSPSFT